MRIDMHCHAIGKGTDITKVRENVYFNPEDNQHWFTRILYNMVENDLVDMDADLDSDGTISTPEYFDLVRQLLLTSKEIDAVVLLAMDAMFDPATGELDAKKTDLWVSNEFLLGRIRDLNAALLLAGSGKRFFLGASINPNRKDWEAEFAFAAAQPETVLMKLIPSAQGVHLTDDSHRDFYRALKASRLPLLCHVGPEYSFPEGIRNKELDNYRFLEAPLAEGVKVIAAHCATPVFPIVDKEVIEKFYAFMQKANASGTQMWADTSALSISTRLPFIPEIVHTFPPEWLINGSDFPIPMDGWMHLPLFSHDVSLQEYIAICKTNNALDKDVRIKRAHGFDDGILGNAANVLRLS